jgi:hypothetical protein
MAYLWAEVQAEIKERIGNNHDTWIVDQVCLPEQKELVVAVANKFS